MTEELSKELQRSVQAIIERYRPERVVLFGSTARGESGPTSDVDLLVVKRTTKRPMERVRDVVGCLPHTIAADIIVLTPEEFAARQRERHYLMREILADGKTLYERAHKARD